MFRLIKYDSIGGYHESQTPNRTFHSHNFCPVAVFAAGDSYFVIKDKNGICKVIKGQEKTPATIAGPFKTKEEAVKAKEKECAKASNQPSKPTSPPGR
ncbi:MAG: hypothetical protein WC647_19525 [Desulfomonilaceae bacterium]|jgi:hypothetical protein